MGINKIVNGFYVGKDKYTKENVYISDKDKLSNTIIMGPTGCRKSYFTFKPMILDELNKGDNTVILLDPRGDWAHDINSEMVSKGKEHIYIDVFGCLNSFNPLYGDSDDIIQELVAIMELYHEIYQSPDYYLNVNIELIKHSVKLLKSIKGNKATFNDFDTLINSPSEGIFLLDKFKAICKDEYEEVSEWFNKYYSSKRQQKDTVIFKRFINAFVKDQRLGLLANPDNGKFSINFEDAILSGKSIIINSAVGILREDGWMFNQLLLQKLNTILNKRVNTDRRISLYMEDYDFLSNERTDTLFSNSKNLNLSIIISVESLNVIREESRNKIDSHIGNLILYPGISFKESECFSGAFLESLNRNSYPEFEASNIVYKEFGEFYVSLIKDGEKELPRVIKR